MKVRYEMETPWPTDVPAPEGIDGINWFKHGEMPFVPTIDMEIDNGDGDLRKVLNVYWCAENPHEVTVHFQDDVARELGYWRRGGWQSDELLETAAKGRKP
ncbi:hypothetical protein ACVCL0_09175 [Rhodanobacter sp. UC4450_H17]